MIVLKQYVVVLEQYVVVPEQYMLGIAAKCVLSYVSRLKSQDTLRMKKFSSKSNLLLIHILQLVSSRARCYC